MRKYIPSEIEPKWQEKWASEGLYTTDLNDFKNKYYCLVELPYTSGDLHMGHWFTFTQGDILARFKRLQGYDVLFPNGFDTFGLPAENAAIRNNMHPREWTNRNIERMYKQFKTMGVSIDFDKTAITCEPEYYKWNQWIFLKMYKRDIAYKGQMVSNWCPSCKTVLADENVEAGKCWRCGTNVVRKEVEQWFLRLTAYADRLLWQDPPQVDWPKPLRDSQNNWIGKSIGVVIKFDELEVFTTRQDTIFGATFIVISPELPLLNRFITPKEKKNVEKYLALVKGKSELERKEEKEKTGVFTGSYVKNPLNNQQIPVWVADYVLMGYGTGAVMGVPAHDQRDFEFAKKFGLEIKPVIEPARGPASSVSRRASSSLRSSGYASGPSSLSPLASVYQQAVSELTSSAYEGEGVLINSGEYTGMTTSQAREKISEYIEMHKLGYSKVNYHLHDWSISRQRYWGTPIPIIYCEKCGTVTVPEKDLPVELPYEVDYTPQGKPPLATVEEWVKVKCPKCGGNASREVETMDGFFDNSWYFYRYLDHLNDKEIFDKEIIKNWFPVNFYIGGAEHTVGHTLYSRFFTKFFHDLGLVDFDEYALKRINHGVILGPDGSRMSKSKGNVVNPDEEAKKYGADAIRVYLMFLGPYDIVTSWNPDGVNGIFHFLQRVWMLQDKITLASQGDALQEKDLRIMHKTIKKVGKDIEDIKYNTAIAALMEWLNYLSRKGKVTKEEYKTMLLLLAPFAPHITEELWQELIANSKLLTDNRNTINDERLTMNDWSIHQQEWPKFEEKYLVEQSTLVVVQVNGKVRDTLMIQKDILNNEFAVKKLALKSEKVQRFLGGATLKKTVYIPGKVINIVV